MKRNIFISFILFFILIGWLPVLAVTVSQDVLPADPDIDGGGPPSLIPSAPTPIPIIPPVVPPITPPFLPPITPIIPVVPTPPSIIPPSVIPSTPDVVTPIVPPGTTPATPTLPWIFGDNGPGVVLPTAENITDVVTSPVGRNVTRVALPLGIASGIALVAFQAILSTAVMTITSISDIYLLGWRLLGLLFGAGKRRGKPWGTVYDSITKRPLDPAYVVISNETGEEVSDAITDLDGRYGFLVPSGLYKIKASKTNYSFPTKSLENKNNDEIYDNIYHGENVEIKEGEVVVRNIPLDPVGFDWNEFEKNKQNLFRIYSEREIFWRRLFDVFYIIGFSSALIATIFDPRTINIVFLSLYFLFVIYGFIGKETKKAVSVKYSGSMEPIPFAIIKIFFAELNNQVKTVVADHMGRFYFLVGPGKYYFTVDKKQPDGSYLNVHKSNPIDLPHGVLNQDILI